MLTCLTRMLVKSNLNSLTLCHATVVHLGCYNKIPYLRKLTEYKFISIIQEVREYKMKLQVDSII